MSIYGENTTTINVKVRIFIKFSNEKENHTIGACSTFIASLYI